MSCCDPSLSACNIALLRDEELPGGNRICVYDQQPSDMEISPCSIFEDFIHCFESFMSQDL
jgi:hypothetical protein